MIFFVCVGWDRESEVFEASPIVKALHSHDACDSSERRLIHVPIVNGTFFEVDFLACGCAKGVEASFECFCNVFG